MQDPAIKRLTLPSRLRRQQGYSVVELSIALSIIAILTVAGLAGVQTVLNTNKSNNQIEQSGQTIAKLAATYQGQTSTAGATQASAAGLGIWPAARVNAGVVTNLFGGNEFVATNSDAITATGTVPTNGAIIYYLQNIPRTACADIANALAPLVTGISIIATPPQAATADTARFAVTPTEAIVKAIGANNINAGALGTACGQGTTTLDLAFLIRP